MGKILKCPNCGETRFNLTDYDSMMVLRADVRCSPCAVLAAVRMFPRWRTYRRI